MPTRGEVGVMTKSDEEICGGLDSGVVGGRAC
jgi:hypothetical protein